MNDLFRRAALSFDLDDLGLIDGPREREIETIVRHAGQALNVSCSAFFVRDLRGGMFRLRAAATMSDDLGMFQDVLIRDLLLSEVLERNAVVAHDLLEGGRRSFATVGDAKGSFSSFLGAPVHGPDSEPIGALIAISPMPIRWTPQDRREIEDAALLLSRHVLLKAAFATIKLMSSGPGKGLRN